MWIDCNKVGALRILLKAAALARILQIISKRSAKVLLHKLQLRHYNTTTIQLHPARIVSGAAFYIGGVDSIALLLYIGFDQKWGALHAVAVATAAAVSAPRCFRVCYP